MTELEAWWGEQQGRIPPEARGLWFGIVELVRGPTTEWMLYVAGCPTFDAKDETGDWAADEYVSFPSADDDYLSLEYLGGIRDGDWTVGLDRIADAIRALRPELAVDVDGIAVGYDDGEFVVIWHR